ncbi:hypothetical protein HDV00_003703 [Rhizophlyctis rosea]|nr:hypothetical protein HDV00_003703 [Rhizophlyctis rosea]
MEALLSFIRAKSEDAVTLYGPLYSHPQNFTNSTASPRTRSTSDPSAAPSSPALHTNLQSRRSILKKSSMQIDLDWLYEIKSIKATSQRDLLIKRRIALLTAIGYCTCTVRGKSSSDVCREHEREELVRRFSCDALMERGTMLDGDTSPPRPPARRPAVKFNHKVERRMIVDSDYESDEHIDQLVDLKDRNDGRPINITQAKDSTESHSSTSTPPSSHNRPEPTHRYDPAIYSFLIHNIFDQAVIDRPNQYSIPTSIRDVRSQLINFTVDAVTVAAGTAVVVVCAVAPPVRDVMKLAGAIWRGVGLSGW